MAAILQRRSSWLESISRKRSQDRHIELRRALAAQQAKFAVPDWHIK
jgi:hypothetical protein